MDDPSHHSARGRDHDGTNARARITRSLQMRAEFRDP